MINVSKLYCDQITPGDWLRYGQPDAGRSVPASASQRKPIVVWNITRRCNLHCVHCYNDSGPDRVCDELPTTEAKAVIDDLARFGVPSILFSGGEPLLRSDLFELIGHAVARAVRAVISTNGTSITADIARKIKQVGVSYVGVSLDGIGRVNDGFRGVDGAFDRAVAGIRHCRDAGVRVGLRLTLTRRNVQDLEGLFDFFEAEQIERACFYHLVPSGRGAAIADEDLTHAETRNALDLILAKTRLYRQAGRTTDILTVDNHVDGAYLYLKLLAEDSPRAADVWRLLTWNGGGLYSSGVGIGCIDCEGKVHPDQFWRHYDLGNVRERPFSEIWTDPAEPLLAGLRDRRSRITGRCRRCRFFDACGGSLRVRADLSLGDPWAPDPACYLTDEEISNEKSEIDGLDGAILNALQNDFPLGERPFDILAERLAIDADDLWRRVQRMLDRGVIRRLGASLDSAKLGFCSTLAAVRVGPDVVGRAVDVIGRYPEVTHCYLRDHEFNIWFTVIARDRGRIETILGEIRDELGLDASDVLNLRAKQVFKLDARFGMPAPPAR
jgi:radical SAM protein with 4Fe4S-binding SPASM domain